MYENNDKSKLNTIDFKHANYTGINEILSKVDWDDKFEGRDIDGQWKCFCETILNTCDGNAPVKKFAHKLQPKWFNTEARNSQEHKYAMWVKYRESNWDYEIKQEYVSARNKYTEVYRKAKMTSESKLAKNITVKL